MIIEVGDVIVFRELTEEEHNNDAWGDDDFFAGKSFEVIKVYKDNYWLWCEELPMPMGCFDKSFFDSWDEVDFVITNKEDK